MDACHIETDMTFVEEGDGYIRMVYKFDNGYGASVIYLQRRNCWELARLIFDSADPNGYTIMEDEMGDYIISHYLNWPEVEESLACISRMGDHRGKK